MKGKIFFCILIFLLLGVSLWASNSIPFNIKGIFFLQNGWSGDGGTYFPGGGYPGKINYNAGSGQILSDGTLSGGFWMGNVGWVSFSHGITPSSAKIECPTDIWNDATQPCPVKGAAWSENAGWIVLDGSDINSGSGVFFDPNTGNFAGWAWSRDLGWIPFWTGLSGSVIPDPVTPADPLDGIPINFVSKIAIVGNIAGSRIFSVENNSVVNQDIGYSYRTINHSSILNMIRKNIALMSRNIDSAELASRVSPHEFLIKQDGGDYYISSGWNVGTINGKRTVIVIGGDIVIDNALVNAEAWSNPTIGLIALKDSAGRGGNIVITDEVKRIYAYMYAEGSVYSGKKPNTAIVPYTDEGIWNIPKGQLYIRGLVASKNTIGGSQQKPSPICPMLLNGCSPTDSYAYDWDYFRTYDATDLSQQALPPERIAVTKLQNATMIIEYDPHILTDPPPGFSE